MRFNILALSALFFCLASLSACSTAQDNQQIFGPVSLTGSVIPAGISLERRGTHLLSIDNKHAYYLESKTVNLQAAEGKVAHVEGESHANIKIDQLPVIVVNKLTVVGSALKDAHINDWSVSLQMPAEWDSVSEPNLTRFFIGKEAKPFITITKIAQMPTDGKMLFIDGHKGIDVTQAEGIAMEEQIALEGEKGVILAFHFKPTAGGFKDEATRLKLREQFLAMVQSARFSTFSSSSSSTNSSTEFSQGETPCGGPAGIICPQGYFCNVVDTQLNIGRCKKR